MNASRVDTNIQKNRYRDISPCKCALYYTSLITAAVLYEDTYMFCIVQSKWSHLIVLRKIVCLKQ